MNQELLQDLLADPPGSVADPLASADAADGLRFVLRQTFRYEYTAPVSALRQRLIAIPPEQHGDQKRISHRISAGPEVSDPEWEQDRFGNLIATVAIPAVSQSVLFSVEAVVERDRAPRRAVLQANGLERTAYSTPTRLTEADERITDLARQLYGAASDKLEAAERMCVAVHQRIRYQKGLTDVQTTAMEAFEFGAGVCQDHAHVMLAMCRAVGISARYISGHLLGEGATHAWVEVLAPSPKERDTTFAFAFDPCYGRRPDISYLTIAAGRDYSDVPPTSGTYVGRAQNRLSSFADLSFAPFRR